MPAKDYIGEELELFARAKNWKAYYSGFLKPYIRGKVLEVGAGLGATTPTLVNGQQEEWVCLEPDEKLAEIIEQKMAAGTFPKICRLVKGTLDNLPEGELFDTIVYIDVVEHIEDDKGELAHAAKFLKPGGKLVILVPAFQSVYSPFDEAVGHFRRYTKRMLRDAVPSDKFTQVKLRYMDSMGILASFANKLMLRQSYPSLKQVLLWDRWLVPVSKVLDVLTGHSFGKSVVGVWERNG